MSDEQKPKRKNERKKEYIPAVGGGYEHGIYKNLKNGSNFDVLVSMRIDGRQHQRSKENLQSIGLARSTRNKFVKELEMKRAETERGNMFWPKALEMYLRNLESLKKDDHISESTYQNRKTTLEFHTKNWGTMRLSDIHTEFIREFFKENFAEHSDDTKRSVVKYIRQVFAYQIACGNKTLVFNPAAAVKFKKTKKLPKETMTLEEIKKLINYTEEQNSEWGPVYFLALQLGCRSGELFGMAWSDIDWKNENIKIERSYCWRSREYKLPKNDQERTIPLNPETLNYLKELRTSSRTDETYILPRISSWKSGRAAAILRNLQYRLGITETNFHSIRAVFVTQLLLAGQAPVKVQKMAGHADYRTTDIYVRSVSKELHNATNAIGFTPNKPTSDTTADILNFQPKKPLKKPA